MRVLIVSSCCEPWGGSEELWWSAAQRLLEAGHQVRVLKTLVDPEHPRIRALTDRGCTLRDLRVRRWHRAYDAVSILLPRRLALDARRRAALEVARDILRMRPHLALVSQGQNYDGLVYAHACRVLRVPYVVIAQKASELYWPPDEARHRHRAAYCSARRVGFVCQHNRDVTEDQLATRLERAVVLSNAVLIEREEGPLPWPANTTGELRLACVGRLSPPDKGQDALLRVLALDHWRKRPLSVTFYGDGHGRRGLEDLVSHLGLRRVAFAGHIDDVHDMWRTHHGLVLPSRTEGLPLALVEALMCGRPAIVTDVGGNAEVLDDDLTGFLASGPEVAALDAALERAWRRRAEWREMGIRAAEDVRSRVSADPAGDLVRLLLEAVA